MLHCLLPMQTAARGSSSKRVFAEISNLLIRSNIRWRGKAFAASVPTSSFKPQKGQKISKQVRRAMVETFIDKYRASNTGRFPTASQVQKEIGGSYYVVRQIVQELEYENKISPSSKLVEAQKVICPSSGLKNDTSGSEPEQISRANMTKVIKSNMELYPNVKLDEHTRVKDAKAIMHSEAKEVHSRKVVEVQKVVCTGFGLKEGSSVSEPEQELKSDLTEMVKSSMELHADIKLDEHHLVKDDGAIVNSKELPPLDSVEKSSVKTSRIPATTATNSSNEQILNGDPIVVGAQVHEKDVPSGLAEESLRENSQGTSGSQESKVSKDSTATVKVDFSVILKSESTKQALSSTTGVAEGRKMDTIPTEQDACISGVEQIDNHKAPIQEKLNSDHPRWLGHMESMQKAASVWGTLKSFADGIISFWKKK